jgi:hypothetical protein
MVKSAEKTTEGLETVARVSVVLQNGQCRAVE